MGICWKKTVKRRHENVKFVVTGNYISGSATQSEREEADQLLTSQ